MSISKLNNNLHRTIADFAGAPHQLMLVSKGWRANVAAALWQGYSQQNSLRLYVEQAKLLHPNDHAEIDRARAVASRVLKDATGEIDGRGGIFSRDILYPNKLNQLAERAASDFLVFARKATLNIHGEAIISFANNVLKEADTDSIEKAEAARAWMKENALRLTKERVFLEQMGLSLLPPEIQLFAKLQILDLSENKLRFLPVCIGSLQNLNTLALTVNALSSLPAEISKLSKLHNLWCAYNQLTSLPVELSCLTKLELGDLAINDNPFTNIPRALLSSQNQGVLRALSLLPDSAFAPIPPPPELSLCERLSTPLWTCCSYVLETLAGWFTALARWIRS